MTVEAVAPVHTYTIAGIGPYAIQWSFSAGSVKVAIANAAGTFQDLGPAGYTITPTAGEDGNLFLTPAVATAQAGRTLAIMRDTNIEQGWLATLGERERGLERQLDEMTRATQEAKSMAESGLRIPGMEVPPVQLPPGTTLLWDGSQFIAGPTAAQIATAQVNAEIANAAAARAEAFAGINNLNLRNGSTILCSLMIGQSWGEGFYSLTTGADWQSNAKNRVWRPDTNTWGPAVQSVVPFHPNGSRNELVEFCNKVAEKTALNPYFYVNADGAEPISSWVGTPGNRTISVGNRPLWVELQNFMVGGVYRPDLVFYHQGVADHATYDPDEFAAEVNYLIKALTAAGYMLEDTPFIMLQAPRGDRNLEGLSQNGYRTNNMIQACLRLGDPRIRVVDLAGVETFIEPTGDPAFQHFTDEGVREIGRNRMYAAWRSALAGNMPTPQDPGLYAGMDKFGFPGFALRRTEVVAANTTYVCTIDDLNGTIHANQGCTINFPDFGNAVPAPPTPRGPNQFTSNARGGSGVGAGITVIPRQVGTYTFTTNGAGFLGNGPLYTNAVATPFTYIVGPRELNVPIHFQWLDGVNWRLFPLGQIGPRSVAHVQTQTITSLAAGASVTLTHAAPGAVVNNAVTVSLPHAWANFGLVIDAEWVSAADVVSMTVRNTSGVSRTIAGVGVTAIVFS